MAQCGPVKGTLRTSDTDFEILFLTGSFCFLSDEDRDDSDTYLLQINVQLGKRMTF